MQGWLKRNLSVEAGRLYGMLSGAFDTVGFLRMSKRNGAAGRKTCRQIELGEQIALRVKRADSAPDVARAQPQMRRGEGDVL